MPNSSYTSEVKIRINSEEATRRVEALESKVKNLRKQFAEAFARDDSKAVNRISRELGRAEAQVRKARDSAKNLEAALRNVDQATPKELQRAIRAITAELNSGRIQRGSKEWDAYVAKLKEVKGELAKVKAEMDIDRSEQSFFSRINEGFNKWGASLAAVAAGFAGVTMAGKAAVQAYADMEAEEANVRKYTGMTAEEVGVLNEAFKKMNTRTSREDLNRLAQEAGRLGKQSVDDVLGFVKAADKINVALDDLGDGATLTLSKLTGIFGDEDRYGTERSLLKIGSVINELSQNCSASAPYLAEFASRIGGIAAQSRMTASQVMAFAAVLDSNNLAVEASATAVGQLITKIYQEPTEIAKAAGMDVKKFSKLVKYDMNGALIALFEQLNKFGGMETLASIFDDMGTDGARAIPVLAALSGHVETLKWQQSEANKAFAEGVSVTNEFNVQNNTVQARLDKAKKGFTEMAVSLGEKLVPVMSMCISSTSMLMRVIGVLVEFFIQYKGVIIGAALAYASYKAAIILANAETKIMLALETGVNAARKVGNIIALVYYSTIGRLTGQLRRAAAAQRMLSAAMASSPWGAILAVIGAVVGALFTYISKSADARREMMEQRKALIELEKSANDVEGRAAERSSAELVRLKALYEAATKLSNSKEQRLQAAQALIDKYPSQFAQMTTEQIMLGESKTAYEQLTQAIFDNAKARAAAELVQENQSEIIKLEIERDEVYNDIVKQNKDKQRVEQRNKDKDDRARKASQTVSGAMAMQGGGTEEAYGHEDTTKYTSQIDEDKKKAAELQDKIDIHQKAVDRLTSQYSSNSKFIEAMSDSLEGETETIGKMNLRPSEKELKAAAAAERKEMAEAKAALKADLDQQKMLRDKNIADNIAARLMGLKTQQEYLAEQERIEVVYANRVVRIHEKHNRIDIDAYGAALCKKMELQQKAAERVQELARSTAVAWTESRRDSARDRATAEYFDPASEAFKDDALLRQRLLDADVAYLKAKAMLYTKGSKERAAAEKELEQRLNQDKLDQQKAFATAYSEFVKKYRTLPFEQQCKVELEMLKKMLDDKLITEAEYEKARADMQKEYADGEKKKTEAVKSEYTDMINNLYQSLSKFFSQLGKEGNDFWGNMATAAQSSFAIMGATMSQFSALSNAERDLELARVEKFYDAEIERAGKNSKKKTALEKQREAAVAKVKTRYNDRAMKMELAQAVAQTAVAAISAYASGSKVNVWLGPVAAAMATAAGMAQIATIKKQHEAEAAGYYSGGYTTRDSDNRREVGVVHANEFVANHRAVANPELRPVLRLIDIAQRTNTVASLTREDVARVIGSPAAALADARTPAATGVSGAGNDATGALMAELSDELQRLRRTNDRLTACLDDGIEAEVVLDGERGLHRKYTRYVRQINNPLPR